MPKSETDLNHQAKPYEETSRQEEYGQPVEDSVWPDGTLKNVYSKKHVPVYLAGIKRNVSGGPQKKHTFLEGIENVFEAFATYASAAISTSIGQILNFFNFNNTMDASLIVTDTDVAVASAAAHTHTVAAGHVSKIRAVFGSNDTRAPTWSLTITPNGGTALVFTVASADVIAQSCVLLGGNKAGTGHIPVLNGPIYLQAGDTITLTCTNFVAADVMRHEIIFEDYTVT